jgi:hypothetical protein
MNRRLWWLLIPVGLVLAFGLAITFWLPEALSRIGIGGRGYQKHGGKWCWATGGEPFSPIQYRDLDADSRSFRILNDRFAMDRSKVFCFGMLLEGADPVSFVVLPDNWHSKDESSVFISGWKIPGADPQTFILIDSHYAKDKSKIYCGNVPMDVADVDAFEVVYDDVLAGAITSKSYFLEEFGDSLDWLDVSSSHPALVSGSWCRDGVAYYYGPARVEGADYASFEIGEWPKAKDKNREYRGAFPVDELAKRRQRGK